MDYCNRVVDNFWPISIYPQASPVIHSSIHSYPPSCTQPLLIFGPSTDQVVGKPVRTLWSTRLQHVGRPLQAVHSLWMSWGKPQVEPGDKESVDSSPVADFFYRWGEAKATLVPRKVRRANPSRPGLATAERT